MGKNSSLYHCLILFLLIAASVGNLMGQNTGIGSNDPTHTLHIKPLPTNPVQDPLRIENLQPYQIASDSVLLVMDPDSGVVRIMHIDSLIQQSSVDQSVLNQMQQTINQLNDQLPKGTYKSISEARSAGLTDGDSFWADPEGIFGCSGCIIKILPGMN